MVDQLDLACGKIAFDDFRVDSRRALHEQLDELKEDLIQVQHPDQHRLLDVGWYRSFSADGRFLVQLIKQQDWHSPVLRLEAGDLTGLRECILKPVAMVRQLRQTSAIA